MLFAALSAFRAAHGHLRVPRGFRVPGPPPPPPPSPRPAGEGEGEEEEEEEEEGAPGGGGGGVGGGKGPPAGGVRWPPEAAGVALGRRAYTMAFFRRHVVGRPDRRGALDALGFQWERLQPEYNLVLEALITFKALHGHLRVPAKFAVPRADGAWAEHLWGLPLGSRVNLIRHRQDYVAADTNRWYQLNEMGFIWSHYDNEFERVLHALKIYKKIHGHLRVPSKFVIPSSTTISTEEGPAATAAAAAAARRRQRRPSSSSSSPSSPSSPAPLPNLVDRLRALDELRQRQEEETCTAGDRGRSEEWWEDNEGPEANGPEGEGEGSWPDALAGLRLGETVRQIRTTGRFIEQRPDRVQQLDIIGFVWSSNVDYKFKVTMIALQTYQKLHLRLNGMPHDFVVPASSVWPEETHGLALERSLYKIRATGLYVKNRPDRVLLLENLGVKLHEDLWTKKKQKEMKKGGQETSSATREKTEPFLMNKNKK